MRIISVDHADDARQEIADERPVYWNRFRTEFERILLQALERIEDPGDAFGFSAIVTVREADKAGVWSNGYGPTTTTKKGQPHLVVHVAIRLYCKNTEPKRSFLVALCSLGNLHERYKAMIMGVASVVTPEREPLLAIEFSRILYGEVIQGAKKMKAEIAGVAADLALKHRKALENFEHLDTFLNTVGC